MSNRLFQGVVHQMRDAIDRIVGVVDASSTVIACSELSRVGASVSIMSVEAMDAQEPYVKDGYTYMAFGLEGNIEYAVFVEGVDAAAGKYARLLAVSLSSIKQYYDEKYDRNNFVKNVVLDNILPGDIYVKARELHFNNDVERVALLIRILSSNDVSAYDVIQNLFPISRRTLCSASTKTISC